MAAPKKDQKQQTQSKQEVETTKEVTYTAVKPLITTSYSSYNSAHRLRVKKLHENAKLPTVANPGEDGGYDLYAIDDTWLYPNQVKPVRTGIAAQQDGFGLLVQDRSSMAKQGIAVTGGVIDAGYTGEIIVMLTRIANNNEAHFVKSGDKIAQMVPVPISTGEVVEVEEFPVSARGEKGFGSSGK